MSSDTPPKTYFNQSLNKSSVFNTLNLPNETLLGFPKPGVGVLIAPGATGKSYFIMNIMLASIKLTDNHLVDKTKDIKILYVSLEDKLEDINRRLTYYKEALQLDKKMLNATGNDFNIVAYKGADRLINKIITQDKNPLWKELKNQIKSTKSDLVIIDTLIKTYEGYDENSNPDMSKVLSYFDELAEEEKCSILLLHHTNKGAIGAKNESSQADSRGASSIVDNSRWVISLRKDDKNKCVTCKAVKTNFTSFDEVSYSRKYKGTLIRENK